MKYIDEIVCGDCLEELKKIDNDSIDCIITSPPYWGLRDYGVSGQLGLEKTFTEYIDKLLNIFNECKRVLKKTGTCWVNLGDSYSGLKIGNTNGIYKDRIDKSKTYATTDGFVKKRQLNVPDKSLCCIDPRLHHCTVRSFLLFDEYLLRRKKCLTHTQ